MFDDKMDIIPLSPLMSESEDDSVQSGRIKRPYGRTGHLGGKGYNSQSKLDWNDRTYESVLVSKFKVGYEH